jgi:hypothetical protein
MSTSGVLHRLDEQTQLLRSIAGSLESLAAQPYGHGANCPHPLPQAMDHCAVNGLFDSLAISKVKERGKLSADWFSYWQERLKKTPLVCRCFSRIDNIQEVYTAQHAFKAEIYVRATVVSEGFTQQDWQEWDPLIKFDNLIEEIRREDWSKEEVNGMYSYKVRIFGTFSTHFECKYYPLDTQQLSFWIKSCWSACLVELWPHFDNANAPWMHTWALNTMKDEWCAVQANDDPNTPTGTNSRADGGVADRAIVSCKWGMFTDPSNSDSLLHYSQIRWAVMLLRRGRYFAYQIVLPSFAITSLAFTSFYVSLDELGDRSSITLTILLTLVAFRQTANADMPKTEALTIIDVYLIWGMMVVCAIVFANALVGFQSQAYEDDHVPTLMSDEEDVRRGHDTLCFYGIGSVWTVSNVLFFLRVGIRLRIRARRADEFRGEKRMLCKLEIARNFGIKQRDGPPERLDFDWLQRHHAPHSIDVMRIPPEEAILQEEASKSGSAKTTAKESPHSESLVEGLVELPGKVE